jgi:hypothetical protein
VSRPDLGCRSAIVLSGGGTRNDTFGAAAPDAPDPVLRLAWVTRAWTSPEQADQLRALELYLDAGDGRLLGGDVLR